MNATTMDAPPPPQPSSLPPLLTHSSPLILIILAGMIFSALVIAAYGVYRFILLSFVEEVDEISDTTYRDHSFKGVDEEILKKIPILSYSTQKVEVFRLDHSECAICLAELEDGELVRLLPSCKHAFHIPCVDAWFMEHSNCPFCRLPVEPPLVSESKTTTSLASENDRGEETVLNVMPNLQSDLRERHSFSVGTSMGVKPEQEMGLKRSLSVGQSSTAISIQHDEKDKGSTSDPSPSAKGLVMAPKVIDHMNSLLMRSFSQVRNSRSRCPNGILPN